jgi:hypothetical protein
LIVLRIIFNSKRVDSYSLRINNKQLESREIPIITEPRTQNPEPGTRNKVGSGQFDNKQLAVNN